MNFHVDDFYFNINAAHQNKTQCPLPQQSLQNNSKQKADFHGRIMYEIKKMKTSRKIMMEKKKRIVVEHFLSYMLENFFNFLFLNFFCR